MNGARNDPADHRRVEVLDAISKFRKTPRLSVALVGADGAGKSTLSRLLADADLPMPVKTVYMGVNLEASTLMLPTTRLLLAAKRTRGGRPDLVATAAAAVESAENGDARPARRDWRRSAKETARLTVWMLEEWLRQLVATGYAARGYLVVFDRHFFADYYHSDVLPAAGRRGTAARLHGWMLRHAYPKPGLVICLDAPAEVLFARKPESSPSWLEQRRQQYLRLADVVPVFAVIDANRSLDAVYTDVVDTVQSHWKAISA